MGNSLIINQTVVRSEMFDEHCNETDVREDLIVPFLNELGYKRGTANDVGREVSLKYEKEFLGRKKATDPTLRGRADYILSVVGAGRWVLEVKGPNDELDSEVVGQALSYAKHPEVSATFAAITNGIRLKIFSTNQTAFDEPILDCAVTTPEELAFAVTGFLSPQAIRRKCTPLKVDSGTPLAIGFPSEVAVVGGTVSYQDFSYTLGKSVPPSLRTQVGGDLERRLGFLRGYVATIASGQVYRDNNSRIIANILINLHHNELNEFSKVKGFNERDYICLDGTISNDKDQPSTFDIVGEVNVLGDEVIYDVSRASLVQAGFETNQAYSGHATGFVDEDRFVGSFDLYFLVVTKTPIGNIDYSVNCSGHFEVNLA